MKDFNTIIGSNLKKIRSQKKISLDKVAEMTGVSKGMLAQIEKGSSNPTVTVLWKIATGLNVSFSYFMQDYEEEIVYISKKEIEPISEDNGRMYVYPLFPYDKARNFEVFTIVLDPRCSHHSEAHSHGVEESIIVAQGVMELVTGDKVFRLEEGDAIRYKADCPHEYKNHSENKVVFQQIIYYFE